jgi:Mn2+/Fe2+ NRAMP family transporter
MKALARRRMAMGALFAVVGPGLIAGLSDDDPAGITTYSVLGAQHGYQLLWVLALSTVALILFHHKLLQQQQSAEHFLHQKIYFQLI